MLLYLGQDYLRRVPMVFLMAVGSGVTAHYFIARTIKFIDDAVGDECAVDKITSLRCVTKLVPLSDVAIFLQGFEVMFAVVVFFVCYCAYSKVAGVSDFNIGSYFDPIRGPRGGPNWGTGANHFEANLGGKVSS